MKFDKKLYEGMALCDGEKIERKFATARANGESWRELLHGENYSLTSTNYATCWKAEHIYTIIKY
jgi:hypothetical protein